MAANFSINQWLDYGSQQLRQVGVIQVGGHPYVDMLLNEGTAIQQVSVAGVNVPVVLKQNGLRRYVNFEANHMQIACEWIDYNDTRTCPVRQRINQTNRPLHAYGLISNGGPQVMLVISPQPTPAGIGQPIHNNERLYVIDTRTAQVMSDLLYNQRIIQRLIDICYGIINGGRKLSRIYRALRDHTNQLDEQITNEKRLLFNALASMVTAKLCLAMDMEEILTHAVEYIPQHFTNIELPEPAIIVDVPYEPILLVRPQDFQTGNQELQRICDSIIDNPHRLYQIDWHTSVFQRYARPNNSITLNQQGFQYLQFDGQQQQIQVNVITPHPDGVELRSDRFLYNSNIQYNYCVRQVDDRRLIYMRQKPPISYIPVYSSGIHGLRHCVGVNGWQAMPLQFDDVGNGEERVYFVNTEMAGRLRRLFEIWDVMKVYRSWFSSLIRFTSLLIEMQRLADNPIATHEEDQQIDFWNNWLYDAVPHIYINYQTLQNLQLLYRHSILITHPGTVVPRYAQTWPSAIDIHQQPVVHEIDDNTDEGPYNFIRELNQLFAGPGANQSLDANIDLQDLTDFAIRMNQSNTSGGVSPAAVPAEAAAAEVPIDYAYGGGYVDFNQPGTSGVKTKKTNLLVPTNLLTQIEPIGPMDPIDPMDFINPIGHDPMIHEGAVGYEAPMGHGNVVGPEEPVDPEEPVGHEIPGTGRQGSQKSPTSGCVNPAAGLAAAEVASDYGGADPNDPNNLLVPTNLLTQIEPIGLMDPIDPMDFINPIGHDPMIYKGAVGYEAPIRHGGADGPEEPVDPEKPVDHEEPDTSSQGKRQKTSNITEEDPEDDDNNDGDYGGADPNDPINLLVPTNLLTQIEPIGLMDPIDPMDFINPIGHDPMIFEGAVGYEAPIGHGGIVGPEEAGTRSQGSQESRRKRQRTSNVAEEDPSADDDPN